MVPRFARVGLVLTLVLAASACGAGSQAEPTSRVAGDGPPAASHSSGRQTSLGAGPSSSGVAPPVSPPAPSSPHGASSQSAPSQSTSSQSTPSQNGSHEAPPPPGFVPLPKQRRGAFPGAAVAEVRAYAFDLEVSGRPVCDGPLAADGRLCSTVAQPGVLLSKEQRERLLAWVRSPASYGPGSACWLPHHGFVFHDAAGVPIAELAVCFLCDMVAGRPDVSAARGPSDGTRHGISEKSNAELRALCRELGLPKCDAPTPDDFGPGK